MTDGSNNEATGTIAGDDLISHPDFSNDQSTLITRPPEDVWPWLAQMGFKRAGWYSWDWIDNLGRRSATTLHPEWMVSAAGELVPAGPISFETPVVNAPNEFVLALLDQRLGPWTIDFTLAYQLTAPTPNTTELATRARARIGGPVGQHVARRLLGPGDAFMVRKQLRGIRDRAESLTAGRGDRS